MNVGAYISSLALAALTLGCASHPGATAQTESTAIPARYEDSASTALAFDPPVTTGEQLPDLSRDLRDPGAFIGFEGPSTTNYWIHTDDWQDSDWASHGKGGFGTGDRYQRRAIMDKTGVSYR